MIKLIVGLGNPGAEYANTRHNAGAWFVEHLADMSSTSLKIEGKLFSRHGQAIVHQMPVRLMIPTTYMNESGKAVAQLAHFFKILPDEILVAHDELDLPLGTIRLKQGGGHGGHNGLRHIIQALSSPNFFRLRIGIDHPGHRDRVHDYVLTKPTPTERQHIEDAFLQCDPLLALILNGQVQEAMKRLHTTPTLGSQ